MSVFMGTVGPVDAILFDLDGTLIDSAPDLGAAADKLRTDRGLPALPIESYRHMAGAGARGMISVAFGYSPEHPDFASLKEEFLSNYERRMTLDTRIFDGVAELIGRIGSLGLAWGVVTNKAARFTVPLTASMALFEQAGVVICGDTTPHSKPHPEPLLEAARRIGMAPERCVYVGDDERDIVAGRAAGMATVAATYGYLGGAQETGLWGAHASIQSPLALLELLRAA